GRRHRRVETLAQPAFAVEDEAVGRAQGGYVGLGHAAALQADDVEPGQAGSRSGGERERDDVHRDAGHAPDHRQAADSRILVDRRQAADHDVVGDRHVAAERRAVAELHLRPDGGIGADGYPRAEPRARLDDRRRMDVSHHTSRIIAANVASATTWSSTIASARNRQTMPRWRSFLTTTRMRSPG